MDKSPRKPLKEPTFAEGLIGSAIALLVAAAIAVIATILANIFWFGTDWFRIFH